LLTWMHDAGADYTNTFRALMADDLAAAEPFTGSAFRAWQERWQARRAQSGASSDEQAELMARSNPAVVPRLHNVEQVLSAAEQTGDLKPLEAFLNALTRPYDDRPELDPYRDPPAPEERVYQTFCGT